MPRPTPSHSATSRAIIKEPHLLAKFAAAQSLHDYSTSPPIAAQTAKLRSEAVGWILPNWKTSTTLRFVGNASVWYDVMKHADRLSRLAMRDSCLTFKRLYAELDFDELDLTRVAFNCRYKKRIYALDYRTLKMGSLDDKAAPSIIAAVPVLREIRAFGRERSKVVQRGSIFFMFDRPRSIPAHQYFGTYDPSTSYCCIETPGKHTLIGWLLYPADDVNTRPLSHPVPRIPPSPTTDDFAHFHTERWTSTRNRSGATIQQAEIARRGSTKDYETCTFTTKVVSGPKRGVVPGAERTSLIRVPVVYVEQ
ncbi:hypothetical protein RQP46_002619 [Phenoliferia psychrophenolica]